MTWRAFFNGDFGDDATIGVLHDLTVLFHLDLARGHDGPGDIGLNRPDAKAAKQNSQASQSRVMICRRARQAGLAPGFGAGLRGLVGFWG